MSGLYRAVVRMVLGVATVSDRRRVRTLAAVLTVAACVASGCTDPASEPKPLPSSSPTATPSVSPSTSPRPAAPTLPPEANGGTPKAAEAFARHYVDLINYAMHSGDTAPLRRLTKSSCSTCRVIAADIDGIYAKSGHIERGDWRVSNAKSLSKPAGSDQRVLLKIRILKQIVYKKGGAPPRLSASTGGTLDFYIDSPQTGSRVDHLVAKE